MGGARKKGMLNASLFVAVALLCSVVISSNPDDGKPIDELVTEKGFVFEAIPIQTADGYICTMHRITTKAGPTKGPVLLQHGFLDSSDTWVLNEADQSLAFMLATSGYHVFLGNSRGNKHCETHTTYTTNDKEFWQFSWDEMAAYDQPAFIGYILEKTGVSSLAYVGHSQGTTQMFAALINQPELTHKIHSFYALAPVTYLAHTNSPLIKAAADTHLDQIVAWFGFNEFLPTSTMMTLLMPAVCTNFLTAWMCSSVMWLLSGYNPNEFDDARMSVYVSHFPSGTSVQDVEHWAQSVRNYDGQRSDFSHYDYGKQTNMQVYGSEVPPIYNLTTFPASTTELLVFSGGDDDLANKEDVNRMVHDLPIAPFWVFLEPYDHLDFVWGLYANNDVYAPIIAHLDAKTQHQQEQQQLVRETTTTTPSSTTTSQNQQQQNGDSNDRAQVTYFDVMPQTQEGNNDSEIKSAQQNESTLQVVIGGACVGAGCALVVAVVSVFQRKLKTNNNNNNNSRINHDHNHSTHNTNSTFNTNTNININSK
eukprot:c7708_g1_i1.p1 GENE.c7708_g1_i1~~c7708_g1_i1.p1  ORF type:complete len:535 (+),score=180.38 c7708_g1_i1:1-1605(+)